MPFKDPAKRREYKRQYRLNNLDKMREQGRAHQNAHRLRNGYRKMTDDERLVAKGLNHLVGLSAEERRIESQRRQRKLRNENRRKNTLLAREWVWQYKETHACEHCGESDPCCLDLHHNDPKEKRDHMARLYRFGLKAVQAEVAKCRVLCSNCHRKFHFYGTLDPLRTAIRQKGPPSAAAPLPAKTVQ